VSVAAAKIVGPADGKAGFLGSIGVRFMINGTETTIASRSSSIRCRHAPSQPHYTAITTRTNTALSSRGRTGALLGDEHVEAGPGDLVHKPRGQWHTFWNAGEGPCRIVEVISPAGFEHFFAELVDLGGTAQAAPEQLGELCQRFALEMDPDSVPELIQRFGVRFPAPPLA
jgi:hypothetical protein